MKSSDCADMVLFVLSTGTKYILQSFLYVLVVSQIDRNALLVLSMLSPVALSNPFVFFIDLVLGLHLRFRLPGAVQAPVKTDSENHMTE